MATHIEVRAKYKDQSAVREKFIEEGGQYELSWPNRCSCCGGPSETHVTLRHRSAVLRNALVSLNVPYCANCKAHSTALGAAGGNLAAGVFRWLIVVLLGVAALALLFEAVANPEQVPGALRLFSAVFGICLAALAVYVGSRKAVRIALRPQCARKGEAVEWLGLSIQNVLTLRFFNDRYADSFAELNEVIDRETELRSAVDRLQD